MKQNFYAHQGPTTQEVFSVSGKLEILEFKVGLLAERVKQKMLEDDNVQEFMDGNYTLDEEYDCKPLESLIVFADQESELEFVREAIMSGLAEALAEKEIPTFAGHILIAEEFEGEQSRLATIMIRTLGPDR